MGVDWFVTKLTKYRNVRTKMTKEGKNADKIVQLELDRFEQDVKKAERMVQRGQAIKQELSEVKKAYLRTRQFMDEFS